MIWLENIDPFVTNS